MTIAQLRALIASLHTAATAYVEKYSKADAAAPAAEEVAAQAERFAKMEKAQADIESLEKLAKFAYTREAPNPATPAAAAVVAAAAAATVEQLPIRSAAQVAVEQYGSRANTAAVTGPTREEYAKALTNYVKGKPREEYAVITTATDGGVLVPQLVSAPLTPVKLNVYRRIYDKFSQKVESFGSTAQVQVPVITSSAGGPINQSVGTDTDAAPTLQSITLTPEGFQSGTFWYSNLLVSSVEWDVTTATLPALVGSRDYGFAKTITAGIIADNTITNIVTTTTQGTVVLADIEALNQALPVLFYNNRAIILSIQAYSQCEALKDGNGRPIFEYMDVQGQHLLAFKGTPIFRDDTYANAGAADTQYIIGACISLDGFKLRDEVEKLIVYRDNPEHTDQTGVNQVTYSAYGYVYEAIALLKDHA